MIWIKKGNCKSRQILIVHNCNSEIESSSTLWYYLQEKNTYKSLGLEFTDEPHVKRKSYKKTDD